MKLFKFTIAAALTLAPAFSMAAPAPVSRELFGRCIFSDRDDDRDRHLESSAEAAGRSDLDCKAYFRLCEPENPGCPYDLLRVTCDKREIFYGIADADTNGKVTITGQPSPQFPFTPSITFKEPHRFPDRVRAVLDIDGFGRNKLRGTCEIRKERAEAAVPGTQALEVPAPETSASDSELH